MPRMASLRKRLTDLIPELAKFGLVGLIGSVIDLAGADYLHVHMGIGPMVSKAISITAATLVTYLGSRFWTFRHRVNQALLREGALFVVLNVIGLGIAEVVIAAATYGLDLKSELAYNGASVVGTGLGTIFRYFSYKKWVFLAGAPGTVEAAVSAIVDPRPAAVPVRAVPTAAVRAGAVRAAAARAGGHGPPWEELEPPADLRHGPAWEHLEPAFHDHERFGPVFRG
ncbi:MAG TPA: GtrA family protein [Streptosporangiaceae bacterium]|nr:GtrA family protein [Streptosporangiaceae bacterium]